MSERKIGSMMLKRNRGENVRTFKSGESKLFFCVDKVRQLRLMWVTIGENFKRRGEREILTRMRGARA